MIELSAQICNELDITYWQLKTADNENNSEQQHISREEKELLRKILLAKGVTLNDAMLEIQPNGVTLVNLTNWQLIFDNVSTPNNHNKIHLAKLTDMLNTPEQKKHTWFKLKNLDL